MKHKVMLVDDNEGIRHSLGRTLEEAGYHVVLAEDGQGALEILQEEGHDIHVVVTDIRMPRVNGYQLAEWMAVWDFQQPIIFISGYGDGGVPLAGPFLSKPLSASTLIRAVGRALREVGVKPPVLPAGLEEGVIEPSVRIVRPVEE